MPGPRPNSTALWCWASSIWVTVQTGTQRRRVTIVGFHPLAVGAPVARAHHQILHPQCRELPVQHAAKRSRFVAAAHRPGPRHLPAHEDQALFRSETLRRLRSLGVDLPHHHNRAGVHVQPELDEPGASGGLCLRIMIRSHTRTVWRLAPSLSAPCHLRIVRSAPTKSARQGASITRASVSDAG